MYPIYDTFRTPSDLPWGPPILLYSGYRVCFFGANQPGRGVHHPPTSSAEAKERVELYVYFSSVPSWTFLGRTLPVLFYLTLHMIAKRLSRYLRVCASHKILIWFVVYKRWTLNSSKTFLVPQVFTVTALCTLQLCELRSMRAEFSGGCTWLPSRTAAMLGLKTLKQEKIGAILYPYYLCTSAGINSCSLIMSQERPKHVGGKLRTGRGRSLNKDFFFCAD